MFLLNQMQLTIVVVILLQNYPYNFLLKLKQPWLAVREYQFQEDPPEKGVCKHTNTHGVYNKSGSVKETEICEDCGASRTLDGTANVPWRVNYES